jgi:deoxyadenosine/deoxycytidine kinase
LGVKRPPFHIAVSGLIGAGKSTLVSGLAPLLGARPLLERFDRNPYLASFYEEPQRWAFQSFMFFFEQSLSDEVAARRDEVSALQERVIEEHVRVFGDAFRSRGYLSGSESELIAGLAAAANSLLAPSDLLLHVDIDPAEALRRIRARALPVERTIDLDYLQSLSERYARFIEGWSESPVLRLRAEEHDFRDSRSLHVLAASVEEALSAAVSA